MSQDSCLSVPWRWGTARCLPGWDAPWVAALPVSSQAGAVIPRLHLWAPGCPCPDLAAACRECTREAPLWNQAISSKLLAETAWLCCLRWPGGHPTQFLLLFRLGVGHLMSLGLSPCVPTGPCPPLSLQERYPQREHDPPTVTWKI